MHNRFRRHILRRLSLWGFGLILVGFTSACGNVPHSFLSAHSTGPTSGSVSVSYATALQEVTDLGLRLSNPCYEAAQERAARPAWSPMGQEHLFASQHQLVVASIPATRENWLQQVRALPGVTTIQAPILSSCSQRSPANGGNNVLPMPRVALITITQGYSYTEVLQDVTALGLRPSNPCYEALLATPNSHLSWSSRGQEAFFGLTHQLVVQPTVLAADNWSVRVRALPSIAAIQTTDLSFHCLSISTLTNTAALPIETLRSPAPATAIITFGS